MVTSGELAHRYLTSRPDAWWAGLGTRVLHINWSSRGVASLEGYGLEVRGGLGMGCGCGSGVECGYECGSSWCVRVRRCVAGGVRPGGAWEQVRVGSAGAGA